MLDLLAVQRHTTADVIEDTMTVEQIQLRYSFYLRERYRDADRLAMVVCARLMGATPQ